MRTESTAGWEKPSCRGGPGFYRRLTACAAGALLFLTSCGSLNIFTLDEDREFGRQAYDDILKTETVVTSGPQHDAIQRVMDNLVIAAFEGDPGPTEAFQWEAHLFQSDDVANAFCLPGGYMGVYSGILPLTMDDAGLAVVMGHEIAHATKRHGTQRLTRDLGMQLMVKVAEGRAPPGVVGGVYDMLYGRPFGRGEELEADRVGMLYMARAGYDPRAAVEFWKRMQAASGEGPPEFLSTHPSGETRIAQLEEILPEALELYTEATGTPAP